MANKDERSICETTGNGRIMTVIDAEKRFFIRMAMTAVHGIPRNWVGCSPLVAALLDLANRPLCAATDAMASRALTAIGARLSVIRSPMDCLPGSVGMLVIDAPMVLTPEWSDTLADGAIVIVRGTEKPACAEEGAINCILDFEYGFSIGLRPGLANDELRQLFVAFGRDKVLADAIVQMALVLQSKNAHVALASDAIEQRDAQIALLSGHCGKPVSHEEIREPIKDPENLDGPVDATSNEVESERRQISHPSRLRRRVTRFAKRLGLLRV